MLSINFLCLSPLHVLIISSVINLNMGCINKIFKSTSAKPSFEVKQQVKRVYLVFMTHFDVGYTTTTIDEIINQYGKVHLPKAIKLGRTLKETHQKEKFIWTTHPWLLWAILTNQTGAMSRENITLVEQGIAENLLNWHAMPFNIQVENYESILFNETLQISKWLDMRFGKQHKNTGSVKDVPSATLGMIPMLSEAGINALHIGVNDAIVAPAFPKKSPDVYETTEPGVWRDPITSKSILVYMLNGYHKGVTSPNMIVHSPAFPEVALAFLMRIDNDGPPQNITEIKEGWKNIESRFPNAQIIVDDHSSLDAFTNELHEEEWGKFPVTEKEIGDGWIYGISSDTKKTRRYRAILRARERHLSENVPNNFSWWLAKLGEHTWGPRGNQVRFKNFTNEAFEKQIHDKAFQEAERSWIDQAKVVDRALNYLPLNSTLYSAIIQELEESEPSFPLSGGYMKFSDPSGRKPTECGTKNKPQSIAFNNAGAIRFWSVGDNIELASNERPLCQFIYRTHSHEEFQAFARNYTHGPTCWKDCDSCTFGKCNENQTIASEWEYFVTESYFKAPTLNEGCSFLFHLQPKDDKAIKQYGAPRIVTMEYHFKTDEKQETLQGRVQWFNKPSTRQPESIWLSMKPLITGKWSIHKLGRWVDPLSVIANGSKIAHNVAQGVQLSSKIGTLRIESLDTGLISIDDRTPIKFLLNEDQPNVNNGIHFSLFNNAWNTNYPLWSLHNEASFRFTLSLSLN